MKVKPKERPVFAPCSLRQKLILIDDTTDIILCGGGAGGGKSRTCLVKALKYINDPEGRVLIVRQTYPQLKISGGLVDESKKIYRYFGGVLNKQSLTWTFPNGATIQFAAIPDDLSEWQGMQVTNILVDEAAEFQQHEILFLIGRMRGAGYEGKISLLMTCNPKRDSFLFNWVEYSLGDDGVPGEDTAEKIRWFFTHENDVKFADSEEELWIKAQEYGLVKAGPGIPREHVTYHPMTFRFIPLTIYDNPILIKNNPGYLAKLSSAPRVDKLRFLYGSWTARATGSGYFRREWTPIVEPHEVPPNVMSRVRSWDLAASEKSETNPDPDWTAGVKMSRDKFGIYYIEHVNRFRRLTDKVLTEIVKTAESDGKDDCTVTIPKDPGAGGKTANAFFARTLAENGIAARSIPISGHSGKLKRFLPFCTLAESGAVRIVRGDWNEDYLTELEYFEGNREDKDDQVDATSDAFNTLAKELQLPTLKLPNLQQASPIPIVG